MGCLDVARGRGKHESLVSPPYRFHKPFATVYVVPRGDPAPRGARRTDRRFFFFHSQVTGFGGMGHNDRELQRLLGDLGLSEMLPGTLDPAHRIDLERRLDDALERRFELYEVPHATGIVRLEGQEEPVATPDSGGPSTSDEKSFVGILLVDQDGTPVPNRSYRIIVPDGSTQDGTLDSHGAAMIRGLDPGNCQIWCPYVEPHPETSYIVKDGDHISGIAQAAGFDDYSLVWNDPGNADLRSQRQDPHVLQPGDSVTIPEVKAQPAANKPTGARHKFQIQQSPLKLRLKLRDLAVKPMANVPVTLDGASETTDGDGLVESATLDKSATQATIEFADGVLTFSVGALNPSDDATEAGYKARLFNMGFLWDDAVSDASEEMAIAVEDFQAQYGLQVTGQLDATTSAKILSTYGC
jgi:hypothetical protein